MIVNLLRSVKIRKRGSAKYANVMIKFKISCRKIASALLLKLA